MMVLARTTIVLRIVRLGQLLIALEFAMDLPSWIVPEFVTTPRRLRFLIFVIARESVTTSNVDPNTFQIAMVCAEVVPTKIAMECAEGQPLRIVMEFVEVLRIKLVTVNVLLHAEYVVPITIAMARSRNSWPRTPEGNEDNRLGF